MTNLKTVMHPETREIVTIDANKEPNRMSKYFHRNTGLPFENPIEEVVTEQPVEEVIEEIEELQEEEAVEMTIEELHTAYEEKTGKKVSNKYKNDAEWIISKINE